MKVHTIFTDSKDRLDIKSTINHAMSDVNPLILKCFKTARIICDNYMGINSMTYEKTQDKRTWFYQYRIVFPNDRVVFGNTVNEIYGILAGSVGLPVNIYNTGLYQSLSSVVEATKSLPNTRKQEATREIGDLLGSGMLGKLSYTIAPEIPRDDCVDKDFLELSNFLTGDSENKFDFFGIPKEAFDRVFQVFNKQYTNFLIKKIAALTNFMGEIASDIEQINVLESLSEIVNSSGATSIKADNIKAHIKACDRMAICFGLCGLYVKDAITETSYVNDIWPIINYELCLLKQAKDLIKEAFTDSNEFTSFPGDIFIKMVNDHVITKRYNDSGKLYLVGVDEYDNKSRVLFRGSGVLDYFKSLEKERKIDFQKDI